MAIDLGRSSKLVVGTRGSALARAQTEEAIAPLRRARPDLSIELKVVQTKGDREQQEPLSVIGGTGVFVKEIERQLLQGQIDIAVHSLKDVPPALEPGLEIVAVPARADPRDALISRDSLTLAQLPAGSRVGTGSARRRALLMSVRPDVEIVDVRGNVDTRISKVRSGQLDAVVLAAAGLQRIGRLGEAAEIFDPQFMLPAPGQGALAIEACVGDKGRQIGGLLDDPETHASVRAERAFLRRLGSGCLQPVGAFARIFGDTIELRALIADLKGGKPVSGSLRGPRSEPEALGRRLAEELMATPERPDRVP
jgi:hydroxymethylbilane synthase